MDEYQEYILEKIEIGFRSKQINESLTNSDIKRLKSRGDIYNSLPQKEWNEWSRKVHWALQVAFLNETEWAKDINKLNEWREKFIQVVINSLNKEKDELLVLDNAVIHFVQKDLLRYMIEEIGRNNLTEVEKGLATMFKVGVRPGKGGSGCLGIILILIFCTIGISLIL